MTGGDPFWTRFGGWLSDGDTWFGSNGIVWLTRDHMIVALVAGGIALLVALPPATYLAHHGRAKFLAAAVAGVGRSIPSLGVIVLLAMAFLRSGRPATFWPLVIALVLLAVPPIFTNTYTAVADVDRDTLEAAAAMGFTRRQLIRDVELPLAAPVVLDGVRLAFVQVVSTVTLGALVGPGGGLGQLIIRGFSTFQSGGDVLLVGGAILVTLLTLGTDFLGSMFARQVVPPGVRRLAIATSEPSRVAAMASHA